MELGVSTASIESIIVQAVKLRGDVASLCVEDERHVACMFRRVTEEDADSGPVGPLVVGLDGLEFVSKDIDRGPEGMKVT